MSRCDLCGWQGPFVTLARNDAHREPTLHRLGITGLYTTVLCKNCGWVFKPRKFSKKQLIDLYAVAGGNVTLEQAAEELARERSRDVYELVSRHMQDVKPPWKVLDVGGGRGQVSQAFQRAGHPVTVLDLAAVKPVIPEMTVAVGSLGDYENIDRFDVVILSHVLEHMWSPTRALEKVKQRLRSRGCVFLEVPFELYTPMIKRKLGDPCHVGYFSKNTVVRFLNKTGLTVRSVMRTVAPYNTRRVMVLRSVAKLCPNPRKRSTLFGDRSYVLPSQFRFLPTVLEMFHPKQIALILLRKD